MRDDPPLLRQWLLLRALSRSRHGLTVQDLSHEAETTDKTIRRDLDLFQRLGFPVEATTGPHGRKSWRITSDMASAESIFTFDELIGLYFAHQGMQPLAGTQFGKAAARALAKIRSSIDDKAWEYLRRMSARLHSTTVGAGQYADKADIIAQLMQGIADSKATLVNYQSMRATEPVEYELHPLGLVVHRGSLYLVAFSRDHGEVRHFKIDRMSGAEVTDFPFSPPKAFDLKEHLADAFGIFRGDGRVLVRVRFLPPVVRYVEESQWHPTQKLQRQRDGSLLAEFRLSSAQEIMRWLLSFGPGAIVESPPSLVKEMRKTLRQMSQAYEESKGTDKNVKP